MHSMYNKRTERSKVSFREDVERWLSKKDQVKNIKQNI